MADVLMTAFSDWKYIQMKFVADGSIEYKSLLLRVISWYKAPYSVTGPQWVKQMSINANFKNELKSELQPHIVMTPKYNRPVTFHSRLYQREM